MLCVTIAQARPDIDSFNFSLGVKVNEIVAEESCEANRSHNSKTFIPAQSHGTFLYLQEASASHRTCEVAGFVVSPR